jgi:phosphoribosylformylglycinamidine cyclo-ligase
VSKPTDGDLTYKSAGVDIDAGNALVERIKPIATRTKTPGVLTGLGGFGAQFALPLDRYKQPVLVAGTDGVGTKLKLAIERGKHENIGIDLVAMCANDIIVQGAEPLFFLDYYATGRLDVETATAVIEGIGKGCELAGAALVGGETAEMPGMYAAGDYDLAGFCVGVVERDDLIDGSRVQIGDKLIGLTSSGPHANGYSLIRELLARKRIGLETTLNDQPLGELLLEPTRIYVRLLLKLMKSIKLHALAHVTGGGITENLPRVLPKNTCAEIDLGAWPRPAVFDWIKQQGNVAEADMLRTFNCGIGMIICVAAANEEDAMLQLKTQGELAYSIGTVVGREGSPCVQYVGEARA